MAEFERFLQMLRGEDPGRPVLFEMLLGGHAIREATGGRFSWDSQAGRVDALVRTYAYYGYDMAVCHGCEMRFREPDQNQALTGTATISINHAPVITDRASFDRYAFPLPEEGDYSAVLRCADDLPPGMKLMIMGPGGVLENVIELLGYENLCTMIYDDEQLVYDVFEQVGVRLLRYYEQSMASPAVGGIISNDDWGFNSQPMLSPADMRRFVFLWHKAIVDAAHAKGLPVVLHSCGNFEAILDDLFALGYDGRHSYEDNILPVEQAYGLLSGRLAVLGGIDVDFLVRATPDAVEARAAAMLEQTRGKGRYALGSGNSIPDYIPLENFHAMLDAARRFR